MYILKSLFGNKWDFGNTIVFRLHKSPFLRLLASFPFVYIKGVRPTYIIE